MQKKDMRKNMQQIKRNARTQLQGTIMPQVVASHQNSKGLKKSGTLLLDHLTAAVSTSPAGSEITERTVH